MYHYQNQPQLLRYRSSLRYNMNQTFNFYTQYHQFYIGDKLSSAKVNLEDFWTDDAYEDRLAIEKELIGVRTQSYGNIKGEINILDVENTYIDTSKYDHIVEGGLIMESDTLVILDCPNTNIEFKIKINPGKYRVRIYSSNLKSVVEDEGDDYYKIEIWPDSNMERKVLKQYIPNK